MQFVNVSLKTVIRYDIGGSICSIPVLIEIQFHKYCIESRTCSIAVVFCPGKSLMHFFRLSVYFVRVMASWSLCPVHCIAIDGWEIKHNNVT